MGVYEQISIHALLAESDPEGAGTRQPAQISIHALLAESDSEIGVPIPALPHDFYPRSPCGERLTSPKSVIYLLDISIHALLAESDKR